MNTKRKRLTARVNVMLNPRLKKDLQEMAAAMNRDVSDLAREALGLMVKVFNESKGAFNE